METNLKKGECGECGNDKYTIYKKENVDDKLLVECTICHSTSIITLSKPKLEIEWHNNSKGQLHF